VVRHRQSENVRVAFRRDAGRGVREAAVRAEPGWYHFKCGILDDCLPGAYDLTVDDDDRPEHAAAAGELLVLGRDGRAAVPVCDRVLVKGRE